MKKIIFFIATLLFLAQACEKDIVIKPPAYDSRPVIECLLMPGTAPKVYLSRSAPFFNSDVTPWTIFIRNAQVILSGGGEEELLQVDSTFDEFFCRWQPFYKGQILTKPNVTYELKVEYGGKTYTANTTTDVKPVEMDDVTYTHSFRDAYGEHQGVVIDFTDPAGVANYYRFHLTRDVDSTVQTVDAYEYSSVCIGAGKTTIADIGWFVYSDKNADGQISRIIMEPSHTFKENDVALVRLQTLDKNAAVWFDHLDKLKQASLNPFIEPVILKEFQFKDAIGVFGSVNLSQEAIELIFPEDNE